MTKFKNIFYLLWVSLMITLFIGCAGSSSSNNNSTAVAAGMCSSGFVYISSLTGCYPSQPCVSLGYSSSYGYVSSTGQCVAGTAGSSSVLGGIGSASSYTYSGTLQITNSSVYQKILKDNRLCEQSWWSGGYNWDCKTSQQASVLFQFASGTMPVSGALALYPYFYSQSGFLPFVGSVAPINNNSGFELRTNGTMEGYNKIFSVVSAEALVANGAVLQSYRLTISYDGSQMGYVDVRRSW
ncbi:MAG: hypothetical protein K1X29_01735 [Bdellovibrionales bacterium]|nr:hypothetical protein [Bdellovibrionales bacterium]